MQRQQEKTEQAKLKLTNVGSQLSFSHFFVPKVEKKYLERKKMLFSGQGQKIESSFFGANLEKNGSDRVSGKKILAGKLSRIVSQRIN